jgi:apolipoprotein N-acyltransferase
MTASGQRLHRRRMYFMAIVSGVMLGVSFPPFPLGLCAWVGLVPLLLVLNSFTRPRGAFRFVYAAMLVFHLITLNWTGDYVQAKDMYMMIAGAVTMIIHPLFYFIPLGGYLLLRRHLGERVALTVLPFLWTGYEYSHSLTEWSFPWLTLGNSQSYNLARIQFIEWTGVFGVSFWLIVLNIAAYLVIRALIEQRAFFSRPVLIPAVCMVALVVAPSLHGWFVLRGLRSETITASSGVNVGIIQADIDPWDKWTQNGYSTVDLYMGRTRALVESTATNRPDIVLWPETAFPFDILAPANRDLLASLQHQLGDLNVSVLTGLPHRVNYSDSISAPRSARKDRVTRQRYDWFNSAALLQSGDGSPAWYGKMKLVPFAERVPYAEALVFMDFLRWDVGIGGWQIGPDTTVFQDLRTGARFNALICYESTYPGFVASFVRKGAEFIALITIDSWWDHMSGAYQHQQMAIFRAIENRRWVARCAVGGISCFIDPSGKVYDATELFTQRMIRRRIERRTDLTMYARYGDWLGDISLWVALILVAAAMGQAYLTKNRKQLWEA